MPLARSTNKKRIEGQTLYKYHGRKMGTARYGARRNPVSRSLTNKQNVNMGYGFPKKLTMTHRYVEAVTVTSTSGGAANYQFSANSLFDPNVSSTGHQPMYFDQLAALYDHYVVIGSKIRLRVMPTVSNHVAMYCNLGVYDDSSFISNDPTISSEQTQVGFPRLIPAASNNAIQLTAKWSAKKMFGGSVLSNNELKGTGTTSPSEQSVYTFNLRTADQVTTTAVYVEAIIEYIAVWKELKDIAAS